MKLVSVVLLGILAFSLSMMADLSYVMHTAPPPVDKYHCGSSGEPNAPSNSEGGRVSPSQQALCASYWQAYLLWRVPLLSPWYPWLELEIVEAAIVILPLVFFTRIRWPLPQVLTRARTPLPRSLRALAMLSTLIGLGFFAFATSMDIAYGVFGLPFAKVTLYQYWVSGFLPKGAAIGLCIAALGVFLLRLKDGVWTSFQWAVLAGSLAVGLFMTSIFLFDPGEAALYVTKFASRWTLFGFPILSNCFALIVSWFLFGWMLVKRRASL